MNGPLMLLGPHQFYVDWLNFQSFDEEFSASWVTMPRFGVAPGLQFTGFGEDQKTISGVLFPEEFGDRAAVDAITQQPFMVGLSLPQSRKTMTLSTAMASHSASVIQSAFCHFLMAANPRASIRRGNINDYPGHTAHC